MRQPLHRAIVADRSFQQLHSCGASPLTPPTTAGPGLAPMFPRGDGEGVRPDAFGQVSPRAVEQGQILDFVPDVRPHQDIPLPHQGSALLVEARSGSLPATSQLRRLSAHSTHDRRARTGPHLPQAGEGVGPDVFGRVSPRADEKGQILDFFPRRSSSSRHPPSPSGQSSAGGSTKRVNNSVAPMCNRGANAPAGGQGPFRSSACNLSWKHEAVRGKVPVRTF